MIKFLRPVDLFDDKDTVEDRKRLYFCVLKEDAEKIPDVRFISDLCPSEVFVEAYNKSQKTDSDLEIFRNNYAMQLTRVISLMHIHCIVESCKAGCSINFVTSGGALSSLCIEELSKAFCKLTNEVEVLL